MSADNRRFTRDQRVPEKGATRPRGAHFAHPGSGPVPRSAQEPQRVQATAQPSASGAAVSHAAPRPDETTAFLIAAGVSPESPAMPPARDAAPRSVRPDETAAFVMAAQQGGSYLDASGSPDVTGSMPALPLDDDPLLRDEVDASVASGAPKAAPASDDDFDSKGDYESANRSAGLMTGLIIVSRVTGFVRTWAMGIAFGVSYLASSYNIANNLPNMLYELVMGGMLVTAFLPVYMEARRSGGREAANSYVGNLLSVLLVLLGTISVLAIAFAPGLIWTQSFMSGDSGEMDVAVYFFRFFALQILFYGLGSVFSGVLNAHRDYFWSNFAPVLNNVVVIASFLAFPHLEAVSEGLALTVLAAGTTAGVFVQMACQIPALAKHGVHPRFHIDLRDPMLRKTVSLGVPTLVATLCTFVTASVQNSSALAVQPGTGASVISYARLWYTLPYALLSVSLNTALYTELARDAARGDDDAVRAGMSRGIAQQCFFLIPFALYLIVFSFPLNMIYCSGRFDVAGVELVSEYLRFLAVALPLYGVCMLMQKGCSALMNMRPYAVFMALGAVTQVVWSLTLGVRLGGGMPFIALSTTAFYLVANAGALVWMRRRLHGLKLKVILHGVFFGLLLGALGAAAGAGVLHLLETFVAPLVTYAADGTVASSASIVQTFAYVAVSGIASLVVTFVPAAALKLPEAGMISAIVRRFRR